MTNQDLLTLAHSVIAKYGPDADKPSVRLARAVVDMDRQHNAHVVRLCGEYLKQIDELMRQADGWQKAVEIHEDNERRNAGSLAKLDAILDKNEELRQQLAATQKERDEARSKVRALNGCACEYNIDCIHDDDCPRWGLTMQLRAVTAARNHVLPCSKRPAPMIDIEAIRKLCEEASQDDKRMTPGPWRPGGIGDDPCGMIWDHGENNILVGTHCGEEDASAIARTRNNLHANADRIAALLTAYEELLRAKDEACELALLSEQSFGDEQLARIRELEAVGHE